MSETNIYLVPEDEPFHQKRGIVTEVITYLERNNIVDGYYDESKGWFAQGERASDIYANPGTAGFEYALVYDSASAKLIPEIGYGFPRCPHCESDILESIESISEAHLDKGTYDAWDMSDAAVPCLRCSSSIRLADLVSPGDTMMARFWIEFDCADGAETSPRFMSELSTIITTPVLVLYQRM